MAGTDTEVFRAVVTVRYTVQGDEREYTSVYGPYSKASTAKGVASEKLGRRHGGDGRGSFRIERATFEWQAVE